MPIREQSFRIGCGRYIQGSGNISNCGEEIQRVGTSPLVIGGKTALSLTEEKLKASFSEFGKYEFITHSGTCNEVDANAIAKYAKDNGYDVVLGVGGGVIMDFAKLCAHFAALPIINIPTSSATCAAYTPLSVCYTQDGRTVGTTHYKNEINAVIVDTEIISQEPVRLFLAGVFDSIAKFLEIKQRFNEEKEIYPMGLDYAYVMARRSFEFLEKRTQKCIDDMAAGKITDDVENAIFSTVAVPGIISGVARGSNQTALAHKFYEAARRFFPQSSSSSLHGEIVGVGLLLQNRFNGDEMNNEYLLSLMHRYNMPYRITDVGISRDASAYERIYEYISNSSAMQDSNADEGERLRESFDYLWNII